MDLSFSSNQIKQSIRTLYNLRKFIFPHDEKIEKNTEILFRMIIFKQLPK